MPELLRVENLCYSYGRFTPALRDISFEVQQGDVLLIGGPNGHCKSTLLEICAGLKKPDLGAVFWDDEDISRYSKWYMYQRRRHLGYMFQVHGLISNMTIFDNVALPLRYHGGVTDAEIRRKTRTIMDRCGVINVDKCFPERLSAGQLRCAALARALVNEPRLLLLDEPGRGVDPAVEQDIRELLLELIDERKVTLVMITNDEGMFELFHGKSAILDNGRLTYMETYQNKPEGELPFIAQKLLGAYEKSKK